MATEEYSVKRYAKEDAKIWDQFVKNGYQTSFLFERAYADYHSDRFDDYSLLIYRGDKLFATVIGNAINGEWHSHTGLTYGGPVFAKRPSIKTLVGLVPVIEEFLKAAGFSKMVVKPLPQVYFNQSDQSLEYALWKNGFDMVRRDVSTFIKIGDARKMSKGRKSSIGKAKKAAVQVAESDEISAFLDLENKHLVEKYGVGTVHSSAEMTLLKERFPANIQLFVATKDNEMLAGAITYRNRHVLHLQYFGGSDAGHAFSATDLIIAHILEYCAHSDIEVFDFGISTEDSGRYLNEGLIAYKESFGGLATNYEAYSKDI